MQKRSTTPAKLMATVRGWFGNLNGGRRSHALSAVQRRRRRVALVAVLIGALAGLIELPLPLEDAYRTARAELRARNAPDDIVVIAIDDATMDELGWQPPTRSHDAVLLTRLFEKGTSRVLFDRAYASPAQPDEDRAFVEALRRFKGRVWLGAMPKTDNGLNQHDGLMPTPALRSEALLASMVGQAAPFGLAVRFPTSSKIDGQDIPSISAVLASYSGEEIWYRPDWAFEVKTIPTLSYADVIFDRVPASALSGKKVVVAPTHLNSPDLHRLPMGDQMPGVYFHVLGAHTLKDGAPLELSWYPALLFALAIIIAQTRKAHPSRRLTWTAVAILSLAPLALDRLGVYFEIFPAMIAMGIAARGLKRVALGKYEDATSLLKLEATAGDGTAPQSDVYALRLLNLPNRKQGDAAHGAAQFMEKVARLVAQADPSLSIDTEFAVEGDTLVWCAPALSRSEIGEHGEGLLAIVRHTLGKDRQGTKLGAVLGVDVNHEMDLRRRISHAMLACERCSYLRNDLCISDEAHVSEIERHQKLLADLESAIEDEKIELGYQPKIDLPSGRIVGAEALLRWHHPELGPIAAQEAVKLAEDHDLIDELTLYVVDRAMSDLGDILGSHPEFRVSINFCSRTLTRGDITEDVALILSKHDVPARNIIIEITESVLLDFESTRRTIADLVALGAQVSIDDFGTGYSNLEYIRQLPSAELKIDRRFVSSVGSSEDGDELVRGTIELAHSMSKSVVAEGVEKKETADRLRALGCDMAQGYYFSQAIPAKALAKLLKDARMAA